MVDLLLGWLVAWAESTTGTRCRAILRETMNMSFLKPLQNLSEAKDAFALGLSTERLHKLVGSQLDNDRSRNGYQSHNDSLDDSRAVPTLNLRPKRVKHTVKMEHNVFIVEGRRLRYAVSDNYGDTPLVSVVAPKDVASNSGRAAGRNTIDKDVVNMDRTGNGAGNRTGKSVTSAVDRSAMKGASNKSASNKSASNIYPLQDNSEEMWAVNLHGFFAGGGMYWEESRYLAEGLGLRVLAPSLPGFGGSDPLPWAKVNVYEIAGQVHLLMDHLGIENALLMGHSMGGAIAIAFAEMYPDRTLGVIYRDGAATPAWRKRSGIIVEALRPIAPDVANATDLVAALVADLPDMLIGRRRAETIRALFPDFRRNVRSLGRTIPVGAMLFTIDMTGDVHDLVEKGDIPLLPIWGCFDRIANYATAEEFEEVSGSKVLWVPGGHSWMLARPSAQLDVLTRTFRGKAFLADVMLRRATVA